MKEKDELIKEMQWYTALYYGEECEQVINMVVMRLEPLITRHIGTEVRLYEHEREAVFKAVKEACCDFTK